MRLDLSAGPPLSADVPQLTSDAATTALRQAILDGQFEPGQRLKEAEVAELLGISRTPIKRALLALEQEGLVENLPHRGAWVKTYAPADLDDMYQLRALLEAHAARLAAHHIDETRLQQLRESCERFKRLSLDSDVAAIVAENLFFHDTIQAAAGSDRLGSLVRSVVVVPLVYRSYVWFDQDDKRNSEHHHRRILAAIAAKDGERAAAIMKEHILEARDVLLERLDNDADASARLKGIAN
jgi:DNA-binding GntR family transcriptional regulator